MIPENLREERAALINLRAAYLTQLHWIERKIHDVEERIREIEEV